MLCLSRYGITNINCYVCLDMGLLTPTVMSVQIWKLFSVVIYLQYRSNTSYWIKLFLTQSDIGEHLHQQDCRHACLGVCGEDVPNQVNHACSVVLTFSPITSTERSRRNSLSWLLLHLSMQMVILVPFDMLSRQKYVSHVKHCLTKQHLFNYTYTV